MDKNNCSLIKAKEFKKRLSISNTLFYRMIQCKELPAGIKKEYPKMVYWMEDEVNEYVSKFSLTNSSDEYQEITKEIMKKRTTRI